MAARGTWPISENLDRNPRRVLLATSTSVTPSRSCSACSRSAVFALRFSACASSTACWAAERALKNLSCRAWNLAHNDSSSALRADPAAFQRAIRSRKAPAVGPQSVDSAKGVASSMISSLRRFASSRREFSSVKWALRRRVYWVRAELNRCQRSLSVVRSTRGSAFHSSRSSRNRSTPRRQSLPPAKDSASSTIACLAAMVDAFCSARAALRASIWAGSSSSRASSRAARAARSPTAFASVTLARAVMMALRASSGDMAWVSTRDTSRVTSAARFS